MEIFKSNHLVLHIFFLLCISSLISCEESEENSFQPNILLIVADDLGYTDLGCYGSEIKTPNIDVLADEGERFTSFCAGSTCSPSRAMLLTGVTSHRSGFGTMTGDWSENQKGKKGYEGHLNFDVVTVPRLLEDAGYHTSVAGKWHMAAPLTNKEHWPLNRGFTKSFCFIPGGSGHFFDMQPLFSFWEKTIYAEGANVVESLPEDFYSSAYYADKAIEYIDESKKENKPFFHYLSFGAPHWPLQVKDEHIDLYKGQYEEGYEILAERRFRSGQEKGLIPSKSDIAPLSPNVKSWNELSSDEKEKSSKSMEIYAAMIERLDHHTGRVIDHLKEIGEYENTMIIFMADNGAEGNSIMTYDGTGEWVDTTFDNSLDNMGKLNSYIELGAGWAQAASQPFKWYKAFSTEGGVRVPAIIHYPKWNRPNRKISDEFVSIMDLAPTFLEVAGIDAPKEEYQGRKIYPIQGKSLLPYLTNKSESHYDYEQAHVWELYGRRGVRKGDWKAEWMEEPYGQNAWELYDLSKDISQQNNLNKSHPEKLKELIAAWDEYEVSNGVVLPNRPTAYAKETYWKDEKREVKKK